MTELEQGKFENHLTGLLQQRANHLTVQSGLDEILDTRLIPTAVVGHDPTPGRFRLLLAAAAIFLIGGAGLYLNNVDWGGGQVHAGDSNPGVETSPAALAEAVAITDGADLLVWLTPEAMPDSVQAIADWLGHNPAVAAYSYVDREATYAEFAEYYADNPEVLELVSPDQLPTSFRVATTDPAGVSRDVERFDAVSVADPIESCEQ